MNNNFQIPLQVLQEKYRSAWSGCINIEEPKDASVSWNVYLIEGKIQYISSTIGQQARLDYLWQQYNLGDSCPEFNYTDASEYVQLCQTLSDRQSNKTELKKTLFLFIREGFAQVVSIKQSNIHLNPAKRIKKPLAGFSLEQLWGKQEEQIKFWRQARSYLVSPLNPLYLEQKNALQFYKAWKVLYEDPKLAPLAKSQKLSSFVSLFVGKKNMYEIASKTNVKTQFLAKHLKNSILENLIVSLPFQESTAQPSETTLISNTRDKPELSLQHDRSSSPLIVCVDDSKTVQRQIEMTLKAVGYQVIGIVDPTSALKTLSKLQPAVIFMDINMPNLNGYDLCSLLRKSQKFKEVPIVMLTGRDGTLDRVRAKLVGANNYLTKPCDPNKLIALAKALEKTTINA